MKYIQGIGHYCAKTDRGLKRSQNEDSYLVVREIRFSPRFCSTTGALFAIADGMSGHTGGGLASKMAIESLRKHCMDITPHYGSVHRGKQDQVITKLEKAFLAIHDEICTVAENNEKYTYMGTTLSTLLIAGKRGYIAHVGDSRIYLLRNNHLEQLTHDDTMAQLSVEMGYLKQSEVQGHPLSHSLVQALGQGVDEVFTKAVEIKPGDVFVLCSDGLYDMISDEEILEIVGYRPTAWRPCEQLVEAAIRNGGKDNITLIVVKIS